MSTSLFCPTPMPTYPPPPPNENQKLFRPQQTTLDKDKENLCNSCKRLETNRLHELHESKRPFVPRVDFVRSKLSNFSAHVSGVTVTGAASVWRTAKLRNS